MAVSNKDSVISVSTHSHPKVAAKQAIYANNYLRVSTHSHPKVAAAINPRGDKRGDCFNTQPPEGGCLWQATAFQCVWLFQHTATRRWLHLALMSETGFDIVSTHSHPKVAALFLDIPAHNSPFQHTATRRWLPGQPQ